jgi:hypothetical protein
MWGFQWLVDFTNGFWSTVQSALDWSMDGVVYLLMGAVYLVIDGLLLIITSLVGAINTSSVATNMAANYGLLPPALVYVVNAICLPQGIAIIVTCIIIRMSLNLIPAAFTRI